jgi:hypothetical protein
VKAKVAVDSEKSGVHLVAELERNRPVGLPRKEDQNPDPAPELRVEVRDLD